jgi:hypothetical protein
MLLLLLHLLRRLSLRLLQLLLLQGTKQQAVPLIQFLACKLAHCDRPLAPGCCGLSCCCVFCCCCARQ